MSSSKCKNCGCSEIDVDPARGDAVCTNCGSVLESSIIVSSIQFEDNAHGGTSAIGQFVSSDSKGGARGFGGTYHTGLGIESKELTLRNAKKRITHLAHQMRLNQHCIEIAFNFFKMALSRHLTRGRKTGNVVAACVYMTCRMEGTAHMLIDFCDVLDTVGVYELGRTYLRLSQALCINIPALDPSLYILRFASRLEFGDKTHQVSMTALRLIQRMKRDSMHTGRRPSGLCGAALLMAARLHEFNRSVSDIIKIVKVHESTLRKRLLEFGETPSSSLSLDEFMTVDLEEEQDPPSFKAARKKDHNDRLQKIIDGEEMNQNLTALQLEIEKELNEISSRKRCNLLRGTRITSEADSEARELNDFLQESTINAIKECVENVDSEEKEDTGEEKGIPPTFVNLGLGDASSCGTDAGILPSENGELFTDDLDDEELDQYIMSDREAKFKDTLWMKINEEYLQAQKGTKPIQCPPLHRTCYGTFSPLKTLHTHEKEREKKLAKEKEEGKPERKRKKYATKKSKNAPAAKTAGEAIEKMLQEKRMSTKINYDVLKSLTLPSVEKEVEETIFARIGVDSETDKPTSEKDAVNTEGKEGKTETVVEEKEAKSAAQVIDHGTEEDAEDFAEETETYLEKKEMSLMQLLSQHRSNVDDADEYYVEEYEVEEEY